MAAININFDAAATLYRKKLLLRRRSEMRPGLVELPSFSWRMEKKRQPGMSDKDMVKHWMRYLCMALSRMADTSSTTAFVALVKAGSEGDDFIFRMCCPHQQLLDPLRDAAKISRIVEETSKTELDIRYKFALPDVLCPIVFVYDRAAKQVLLTNENHIKAPSQFLDIERCASTSGFLNFIGTLSLLEAADQGGEHVGKLPQLMRDAIGARRDEWLRWLYHLLDKQALFEGKRVLIDPKNPESYYYDYS